MKKVIKLILIILWITMIFCFSSQKGTSSSNLSNGLIYKVTSYITGNKVSNKEKITLSNKYSKFVRKMAHFSVYLILGVLVVSFISEFNIKRRYLLAVILCIFYALTDELHQYFVPGRSCELLDVLLDSTSSLLGALAYKFIISIKKGSILKKEKI